MEEFDPPLDEGSDIFDSNGFCIKHSTYACTLCYINPENSLVKERDDYKRVIEFAIKTLETEGNGQPSRCLDALRRIIHHYDNVSITAETQQVAEESSATQPEADGEGEDWLDKLVREGGGSVEFFTREQVDAAHARGVSEGLQRAAEIAEAHDVAATPKTARDLAYKIRDAIRAAQEVGR